MGGPRLISGRVPRSGGITPDRRDLDLPTVPRNRAHAARRWPDARQTLRSHEQFLRLHLDVAATGGLTRRHPTHLPLVVKEASVLDFVQQLAVGQLGTRHREGLLPPLEVQVFREAGLH